MPKAGEVRSPRLARCLGPPKPLPAHCSAGSRASPPPWAKLAESAFQAGGPRRDQQERDHTCVPAVSSEWPHDAAAPIPGAPPRARTPSGKGTWEMYRARTSAIVEGGQKFRLWANGSYYTDKKNKAQGSDVACPRSPSHRVAGQDLNPLCLQELW